MILVINFYTQFQLQEVLSGVLMSLTNDNALFEPTDVIKFHFQFGFSRMLLL